MSTRAAAAREAAFLASSLVENKREMSSPAKSPKGATLAALKGVKSRFPRKGQAKMDGAGVAEQEKTNMMFDEASEDGGSKTLLTLGGTGGAIGGDAQANERMVRNISGKVSNKRKRAAAPSKNNKNPTLSAEPVKGGWGILPHNMGKVGGATANDPLPNNEI